jgi:rhamnulokinase
VTCFAAVDLGGQSGRVVLGRVHRQRLHYREVHRFANVPRVLTTDDGTRWHWDTRALWEQTLTGLAAAVRAAAADALVPSEEALDLANRWGIDSAVLPPVVPAGRHAGATLAEVTARLGAAAPVPVYRVASHDTASAVAAATSTAGHDGVVSCGSWALAGCIAAEPALGERARSAGYTNEAAADGQTLLLRNLSGLWLLESCLSAWVSSDDRSARRAELLTAAAALADGGPVVDAGDPALRAPGDMPARLAALAGCDLSPAQTVRCVLDSLASGFDSLDSARAATDHGADAPVLEEPAC